MYLRTTKRRNKDGSLTQYLQLAHNVWNPEKGYSESVVLFGFGRVEDVDRAAIQRLVDSLVRFLSPEDALKAQNALKHGHGRMKFIESKPYGGAFVLRQLWRELHIEESLATALKGRNFDIPVEQAIFAAVANRALDPSSKLAVEEWVGKDVFIDDIDRIQVQHIYRAMDFLLEHEEAIQREVYFATANLLNLEVDLVFFDTTSTYFELDEEDEDGLLRYGHSKDHRPDLPQVMIGLAVTREGIPVRHWVFPGNTSDAKTVECVQKDLADWKLGRCVWVMDRGMNSEENRRILRRAGGQFILGEKLRDRGAEHEEALSRAGRYCEVRDNLQVKEVWIGEGLGRRRFVVCFNPAEAERDKHTREKWLARIDREFEAIAGMSGPKRHKAICCLSKHRSMGRYVRILASGKPAIDRAAVAAEVRLDGKYLLSCSDDSLTAEEVALGYKQLAEVERAFRTLKTTLELRPVHHRREDRIRSHVTLCWLALLLIRIVEVRTGSTWDRVRAVLDRMHVGTFDYQGGMVLQRTEVSADQDRILKSLGIKALSPIVDIVRR